MKRITERLILRPPEEGDVEGIVAVACDWRIAESTLVPHPYVENDAREWIARARECWNANGFGGFAVFLRDSGAFIGGAGLKPTGVPGHAASGYWYSPALWGRGIATEVLGELLRFGFGECGMKRIEANHLKSNPASGRVMEKVGMSHAREIDLPHRDGEGLVAGIVRHVEVGEWRARLKSRER